MQYSEHCLGLSTDDLHSWGWFRLVESKGRTFEELDIMFELRLPTRKFKSHKVDAYEHDVGARDPTVAKLEEARKA